MRPAGDRQVTKLEEVVVEARADDDHGISSLELVYAVKGRGEKVVPFRTRREAAVDQRQRAAHALHRGARRRAGRLRHLLRAGARHQPRQGLDRGAQRHLLPRGAAVQRAVLRRAEPGRHGRRRRRGRRSARVAEGNHRRDVEAAAARDRRPVGDRRARDRQGPGRAEGARRGAGRAAGASRAAAPPGGARRRHHRRRRRRRCRVPPAPWPGPRRRSARSSRTTPCRTRWPPTTSCSSWRRRRPSVR